MQKDHSNFKGLLPPVGLCKLSTAQMVQQAKYHSEIPFTPHSERVYLPSSPSSKSTGKPKK